MLKRGMRLAAAAMLCGSVIAGCADDHGESIQPLTGSSAPEGEPPGEAPIATVQIVATDNEFNPQELTVAAGTEVVWVNKGRNDHDVLPSEGDAWGVQKDGFKPGAEYSRVFTEPGTYEYVCTIHGINKDGKKVAMYGTLIVT